jgi:hypothetical protein
MVSIDSQIYTGMATSLGLFAASTVLQDHHLLSKPGIDPHCFTSVCYSGSIFLSVFFAVLFEGTFVLFSVFFYLQVQCIIVQHTCSQPPPISVSHFIRSSSVLKYGGHSLPVPSNASSLADVPGSLCIHIQLSYPFL